MKLTEKSVWWKLTFPFAHSNYTTIGETIYFPKGNPPSPNVIAHEQIHMDQQREVGLAKFILLYLFVLPLFWNPWRWKWEMEAYTKGSGFREEYTMMILQSYRYGWLL